MNLFFPNYEDFKTNKLIKDRHYEIVFEMFSKKLMLMNNNTNLNNEDILKNLILKKENTSFHIPSNYQTFISLSFHFSFFDCNIYLPLHVYYDDNGKNTHYLSNCKSLLREIPFKDILNIDHFKNTGDYLQFDLNDNHLDYIYKIKKDNHIKNPLNPKLLIELTYCFDKDHKVIRKVFESKDFKKNQSDSYSMDAFDNIKAETMFLIYIQHIFREKENVDPVYINYSEINFNDSNWMKKIEEEYRKRLNSKNNDLFLTNLNILEMIAL